MDLLKRTITDRFIKKLVPNKVLVLLGSRRTGKTVFIQQVLKQINEDHIYLNGEDYNTWELLKNRTAENYRNLIGSNKLLVIDEAHRVPDIGFILKLMVDELKGLKIIISGSSGFDLSNSTGEPLTGRKFTFYLFPFAQMEFAGIENRVQTKEKLEERLIFGSYPELKLYNSKEEKSHYLNELVNSYLLKDILSLENIKNSMKLIDLLRLISFQIGKEVSLNELGSHLGMSKNTVERYLDLLSKVFIIFRLQGYSRNPRKEITKNHKWYFYDNGIRNIFTANLNPLSIRNDVGELWENYLISERIKYQHYTGMLVNNYFWRTYQQQEIDFVEEKGGEIFGYEIKWKPKNKIKCPTEWNSLYHDAKFEVISTDNYLKWIT